MKGPAYETLRAQNADGHHLPRRRREINNKMEEKGEMMIREGFIHLQRMPKMQKVSPKKIGKFVSSGRRMGVLKKRGPCDERKE